MHWTGYIFNDYAKMVSDSSVDRDADSGEAVLVVCCRRGMGAIYWNYPLYKTDPRMGGRRGFLRRDSGRAEAWDSDLMPMFGDELREQSASRSSRSWRTRRHVAD